MSTYAPYRATTGLQRDTDEPWLHEHPMPAITWPWRAQALVRLSCLSGFLSTIFLWSMSEYVFWFGPGVVFGLCVMLPWCIWCKVSRLQTFATVVLAPLGYAAAVYLTTLGVPLFAGLAGCTIAFGHLMFAGHSRIRSAVFWAGVVGWLFGVLFVMPLLAFIGAIAAWQIAVAVCLSNALRIDDVGLYEQAPP